MHFLLENPTIGYKEITKALCTCDEDVLRLLDSDYLEELLSDAFDSIEMEPKECFVEEQVEEALYSAAEQYLRNNENDYIFFSITKDEDGNEINKLAISILDKAIEYLHDDRIDCNSSCRICTYTESCLMKFASEGKWQIGFRNKANNEITVYKPGSANTFHKDDLVLWFGVEEKLSEEPWIISKETKDLSFWFTTQAWDFLQCVSDYNDGTLTWYCAEIACDVPDIDEIRNECMIQFNETDTVDSVLDSVWDRLQGDHF